MPIEAGNLINGLRRKVMAATDIFSVEVWTPRGLVTYYVLFINRLSTLPYTLPV